MEKEWINLLTHALEGHQAHIDFESAVRDIPFEYYGKRVNEMPYTLWQLVEHIRIAQKDILDFSVNMDYRPPSWPDDYWPVETGPQDQAQWDNAVQSVGADRETFIKLLNDPENDLLKPFPQGEGQNLLREALLIIDHTSYHVGQIIVLRRLLGIYDTGM